jgi:hypothetical protein
MTAEQRQTVREAKDAHRRASIDWTAEPRCAGCGIELRDIVTREPMYASDCDRCTARRNRRRPRPTSPQLAFNLAA